MKKPERINFEDIPSKLKCSCEGDHPFFKGGWPQDYTSIGLGYVCLYCAKYMDEPVIAYLVYKARNRVVREQWRIKH